MFERTSQSVTFSDRMAKFAQDKLSESKRVAIAKAKYLLNKEDDIIQAKKEGYTYPMIAEVATIELIASGTQKSFTVKNKDGVAVQYETKFKVSDIKNICEKESN